MKNPADIKAFGTHLRNLRQEAKYSQQELADVADISKLTIQRIENAKYSPTLDILVSIAKGLQLPMKELMNFKIRKS